MKKLNKNFYEERKTVEAMLGLCANNKCACDYPYECFCSNSRETYYDNYMKEFRYTYNAFEAIKQ
ncbi:MAG: hypothetical protein HFI06_11475 [Eubacterium sp.]|jgi:hypothetical protein|nr:hypothetical protein [Eubacterium sp.]NBI86053.1 hypothetical protein [Lachnospiraceae bacterium]